jgi:hypothetical protein
MPVVTAKVLSSSRWRRMLVLFGAFAYAGDALADPPSRASGPRETVLALKELQRIPSESGPVNYYRIESEGDASWIRARYTPPLKTVVLGYAIPEGKRRAIRKFRFRWRAQRLPVGGDECSPGKGDSAAVVYVTWRRTLRWYSLKYVWSAVGKKGRTCDSKRNPFRAQDTVILESGPPLGVWRQVEIDPDLEYRRHFEDGDPQADVPDLVGIGIMTDGDQTGTPSSADYSGFSFVWK